jgi:hypothetical protein
MLGFEDDDLPKEPDYVWVLMIRNGDVEHIYTFWDQGPARKQLFKFVEKHWGLAADGRMADEEAETIEIFFDRYSSHGYRYTLSRHVVRHEPEDYTGA